MENTQRVSEPVPAIKPYREAINCARTKREAVKEKCRETGGPGDKRERRGAGRGAWKDKKKRDG